MSPTGCTSGASARCIPRERHLRNKQQPQGPEIECHHRLGGLLEYHKYARMNLVTKLGRMPKLAVFGEHMIRYGTLRHGSND